MRCQILKALFNRIKTGKCPEKRKVGRPDMGGNKQSLGTCVKSNLQKIPAVQSQDGASVGMYIANGFQTAGEVFGSLKTGKYDQIMNFARFTVFFIN